MRECSIYVSVYSFPKLTSRLEPLGDRGTPNLTPLLLLAQMPHPLLCQPLFWDYILLKRIDEDACWEGKSCQLLPTKRQSCCFFKLPFSETLQSSIYWQDPRNGEVRNPTVILSKVFVGLFSTVCFPIINEEPKCDPQQSRWKVEYNGRSAM